MYILLSDLHSPVHLNSSLILLSKLILVLIQLVQRHVLVGFDCLEEKHSRQRMRVQDIMTTGRHSGKLSEVTALLTLSFQSYDVGLLRAGIHRQHLGKTFSQRETRQSVLPIDCCLRTCSSSSSSLGSSLGGRMPFLLRMSFHSVSAFGSLGKKNRNHGTISVSSVILFSVFVCL